LYNNKILHKITKENGVMYATPNMKVITYKCLFLF